ncbi:hypothetical protein LSH36_444g01013, partial [Paralvinella palmiformis]
RSRISSAKMASVAFCLRSTLSCLRPDLAMPRLISPYYQDDEFGLKDKLLLQPRVSLSLLRPKK